MAIGTYAELQTAAANWLVRADLTARIPEFIALAEARLNRVVQKRQAESDQSLTAISSSRSINLPAGYAEALQCWIVIDGDRKGLQYMSPASMEAVSDAGEPRFWGIDGATLVFERPCDQAYSIILRQIGKYALSDSAPTNTLLTDAPDVYLFATLCEAGPFLRDSALAATYETKLTRALNDLNAKDARPKGQQTLRTEVGAVVNRGRFDIVTGDYS